MYQALYRKYRSQTFGDMVGQEVVATTLRQAVEQQKISHAYLFSGPRGTGKTSAAKIFAKAMNCPQQEAGEPCNACYICQAITAGSLEDVIEIDAASNNGVDEIREIRDKSTYAPSLAQYKVYIIDEVHMLSTGAFNALLKTLEEPTDNVVFILATTELHKIPATILSRVQRFEFKSIQLSEIKAHLSFILAQETVTFDSPAIDLIARRAEGGMRDALSILDQALSLTTNQHLTVETAEEITGSISLHALDAYVYAVLHQEEFEALTHLDTLFSEGKSMSRFATDLLNYLRDLLIVQAGGENSHTSELFQANLQADKGQLFAMITQVTTALQAIKQSPQPKIYAEMMTLRLAESSQEVQPASPADPGLVAQIQSLEHQVQALQAQLAAVSGQTVASSVKSVVPAQIKKYRVDRDKVNRILEEAVEQPVLARENLTKLQAAWEDVIQSLSGPDRALLIGSQPVAANEHHAILAFESDFNAEQTQKRENLNTLFGNILSQVAGFSPEILAISLADWKTIRQEFSMKNKGKTQSKPEPVSQLVPAHLSFLEGQVTIVDD